MMKLRKSRITLAVGAVLGAAALMPATSFGWSVDTGAGNLLTASGGDTLLFPVYSTVDPMTTSFSVTNTSGTQTIAAKIRFREQEHSMDVLDFVVVFSPYDKFDFTVAQGPDAVRPAMSWKDNTCVVGPSTNPVPFPAPSVFVRPPAGKGDAAMSVGHLEVLGMADLTDTCVTTSGTWVACDASGAINLADAAKHDDTGTPADCPVIARTLASQANVASLNDGATLGDVDNVLVGRYVMTGVGLGIEMGGDAIGIRDSDLGPPISAQSNAECEANGTANCVSLYEWDLREWDHPHLGEMTNLANFQDALTAANISGDWSNNPANAVGVDWVLSFPTKYAYLDYIPAGGTCGTAVSSPTWCLLAETPSTTGNAGVWTATDRTDLCLGDAGLEVWDREEQQAAGNVQVSPGDRPTLDLCQELEVFTLAAEDQLEEVRDSVIQVNEGDFERRKISFTNLEALRGWARLAMPWATVGDAVTGVLITTRNTDDPLINNGSLTDLQKDVGATVTP